MKHIGEFKKINRFSVLSLMSVLIICFFSGCAMSPRVSIDLNMSTPIKPDSVHSQWAVLTWCLETDEGQFLGLDTGLAKKIRMDVGTIIFQNWCNDVALEFPFLTLMNGDLFFIEHRANIYQIIGGNKESFFGDDLRETWIRMIGFRNILVHDYLDIDREIVHDVLQNSLKDIEALMRVFAQFL